MSGLTKATLREIRSTQAGEQIGEPIEVQFNPASLKLSLSNSVEGGQTRSRQVRQFVGKSSTELSFDLIFDTADDTTAGGARSVRERTALVEKFVLPKGEGNQKQAPPKVRFQWGSLVIDGIISSLTIDFELFSPAGVPLRAKMGVSIKEQDSKYQFLESGPGANTGSAGGAGASTGSSAGTSGSTPAASTASGPDRDAAAQGAPGTAGSARTDRTATAIAGESAAEFAARNGVDPSAWRSLSSGIEDPLSLAEGLEIDFASVTSALAPIGTAAVLATETLDEVLGVVSDAATSLQSAKAITATGGITAAINLQAVNAAECAAASARAAFATPGSSRASEQPGSASAQQAVAKWSAVTPPLASTVRTPLKQLEKPESLRPSVSRPYEPPTDARALTFGLGVPLRPLIPIERSSQLSKSSSPPTRSTRPCGCTPTPARKRGGCGCRCK